MGIGVALASLGFKAGATAVTPPDPPDISVVRLSDTSIRVTFSSAATTTNRVLWATVANAGDTWTDGGNRTGNGTVDVTVTAGTDLYVAGVRESGSYYSRPSNIVKFNTSIGSGTTMTAGLGFPRLLAQSEADQSVVGEDRIAVRYALGPLGLASANLERGDYLPANADRSIVATTWEIVSSVEMPAKGELPRHAACTARKVRVTW